MVYQNHLARCSAVRQWEVSKKVLKLLFLYVPVDSKDSASTIINQYNLEVFWDIIIPQGIAVIKKTNISSNKLSVFIGYSRTNR
jgi:hypothetical protein